MDFTFEVIGKLEWTHRTMIKMETFNNRYRIFFLIQFFIELYINYQPKFLTTLRLLFLPCSSSQNSCHAQLTSFCINAYVYLKSINIYHFSQLPFICIAMVRMFLDYYCTIYIFVITLVHFLCHIELST